MPTDRKKKLSWNVRCKDIGDKTDSTKKGGIKTIMKTTFVNKTDNEDVKISLSIKSRRNKHPFKNLDEKSAMDLKEGLILTLEYPNFTQKKITDQIK